MASELNYSIRPNKAIERRLIFSALNLLSQKCNWSEYRYIGLGSMWFVDFVMAHKLLGISTMTSMERAGFPYHRAKANSPFANITVIPGECTNIIPALGLDQSPCLIWLDFTETLKSSILDDIAYMGANCKTNSIVLITLNAEKRSLPQRDADDAVIEPDLALRNIAGDLVPAPLEASRLHLKNYPYLLSTIILSQFERAVVNSGRPEKFVKLFELAHSDGAMMVTSGGVVADAPMQEFVQTLVASGDWPGIVLEPIEVPALTLKEKIAVDRLLPQSTQFSQPSLDAIDVKLSVEKMEIYRRFYKHYPVFGEFIF